jgi:hypothetical protein
MAAVASSPRHEALVDADSRIQILEFSAEDGEPANVITVPVIMIDAG